MEASAGNQEELMIMNSSEEFDEQQENEDGGGKSYDCIFCKRGFTNAQALGGHMNIHRKDRAKNNSRPSIINSSKIFHQENYATPIFYQQPISSYPLQYYYSAADQAAQFSYQTCFPPPDLHDHTSGARPSYAHHVNDQNPYSQSLNPFGDLENWQMALSLQFDSWHAQDDEKKKPVAIEEDGLDLELRLGQDP